MLYQSTRNISNKYFSSIIRETKTYGIFVFQMTHFHEEGGFLLCNAFRVDVTVLFSSS